MLSFIFSFSKANLSLNLEKEFRDDDRWDELIQFYEFWEVHSKEIEKQLNDEKVPKCECPSCGANTFKIEYEQCAMCDHVESIVTCNVCLEDIFKSETEVNYDEDGTRGYICNGCLEKEQNYEPDCDDMRD